ncbi:MAG TPA: NAD-dependent epimerase/dehydratase family protein [Gammaproteobacteria bacterium]|nr:NAD-dependent epimerase/dehydratase family protein [Gammaproteobacteria bacterium]
METILGAGGAIGDGLARELLRQGEAVRLVARHPRAMEGAQAMAADLSRADQAAEAVAGSSTVYLTAGLKYDHRLWREMWPRIMANVIEACGQSRARLVFFDNVYMYGRVTGPMTEETPFNPCSRKGEVRARIATRLLEAMKAGDVRALIARSADFYGPGVRNGIPNAIVFDKLAAGGRAMCLASDSVPHAYTYVPDAVQALLHLARDEQAWGQTWHLPTASAPPTGRAFIEMAAAALGVAPRYRVLGPGMLLLGGLFDPTVRELREMLYQNSAPYLFDCSKFLRAFPVEPTPYPEGIAATAAA